MRLDLTQTAYLPAVIFKQSKQDRLHLTERRQLCIQLEHLKKGFLTFLFTAGEKWCETSLQAAVPQLSCDSTTYLQSDHLNLVMLFKNQHFTVTVDVCTLVFFGGFFPHPLTLTGYYHFWHAALLKYACYSYINKLRQHRRSTSHTKASCCSTEVVVPPTTFLPFFPPIKGRPINTEFMICSGTPTWVRKQPTVVSDSILWRLGFLVSCRLSGVLCIGLSLMFH